MLGFWTTSVHFGLTPYPDVMMSCGESFLLTRKHSSFTKEHLHNCKRQHERRQAVFGGSAHPCISQRLLQGLGQGAAQPQCWKVSGRCPGWSARSGSRSPQPTAPALAHLCSGFRLKPSLDPEHKDTVDAGMLHYGHSVYHRWALNICMEPIYRSN